MTRVPFADVLDGRTDWLDYIPAYQRDALHSLVGVHGDIEAAAQAWLEASPTHTASFGGASAGRLFFVNVQLAVHRLLCGSDEDADSSARAEVAEQFKTAKAAGIGSLVTVVSDQLGASPTLLAPVIAVVLTVIGQVGFRAWCETVAQLREGNGQANPGG